MPREPDVLLRGVASLAVRYALLEPVEGGTSTLSWFDSWTQDGQLPALVEIQIELQDSAAGRRGIHRVMHIPGGTLQRIESSG